MSGVMHHLPHSTRLHTLASPSEPPASITCYDTEYTGTVC